MHFRELLQPGHRYPRPSRNHRDIRQSSQDFQDIPEAPRGRSRLTASLQSEAEMIVRQRKFPVEVDGVPQRYLEQVMQQLVRAGVLKGVRGPRGGYRLAKERRRISVGDIVRVAESIEDADNDNPKPLSELGARIVTPLIASLQEEVMSRLDAISIEDLCQRARAVGVDCGGATTADFTI